MQSCDVAYYIVYFYNDSPSTYFYTLSLHEALPILAVAKGIDAIRLGQKPAVLAAHAFRHDNGAVAVVGHRSAHRLQKPVAVKRHFRQQDDLRRIAIVPFARGQSAGCGYPVGGAAHDHKSYHRGVLCRP